MKYFFSWGSTSICTKIGDSGTSSIAVSLLWLVFTISCWSGMISLKGFFDYSWFSKLICVGSGTFFSLNLSGSSILVFLRSLMISYLVISEGIFTCSTCSSYIVIWVASSLFGRLRAGMITLFLPTICVSGVGKNYWLIYFENFRVSWIC